MVCGYNNVLSLMVLNKNAICGISGTVNGLLGCEMGRVA